MIDEGGEVEMGEQTDGWMGVASLRALWEGMATAMKFEQTLEASQC